MFDPNLGLTPLEKYQFCGFLKPMFSLFRKACLLYKTSKIVFHYLLSRSITWEYRGLQGVTRGYKGWQEVTKGYKGWPGLTRGYRVLQNHGLSPLEKSQFCGFLEPRFSLFRKACLLYKTSKIVFSLFIFTIYDMGIPGVTRGDRGLQRVERG